ncbi:UNVERIFIED_CONTAM: hypothetical protein GTU68_000003 [Idotea baltica]|nr:hypothetical protein [Idotea baltica]
MTMMKDQVEALKANGINAAFINSSQSYAEQSAIVEQVLLSEIKLLYVSPEKMLSEDFSQMIRRIKINLFAVDEAHCISVWGHDFRPEYAQLAYLRQLFPNTPMIALTATADKITRRDILRQLSLRNPKIFLASFDRPNLSLSVLPGRGRLAAIMDFVRIRPNQSGIIYCLSRKSTEEVALKLQQNGFEAAFYHAGMTGKARARIQEHFLNDTVPIICATIAFGMGIDKSNVRWVIHYNLPKNIEGYYQEIGRAGRDGLKSDTLLFFSYGDVIQQRKFIEDGENREVKLAKLERMQAYANALVCRRKILLNYFAEPWNKNCGNCDVCNQPPDRYDGTLNAQKALSAIARLKESVGMNLLIEILRGSSRKEIRENGYDQIKTYGAGSDMNYLEWQHAIMQLLHIGMVEVAYDQGHVLKLTAASREVLFSGRKVEMVRLADVQAKAAKNTQKTKTKKQVFEDSLFEELRKLRRKLAIAQRIPPYVVFTDATLKDMAANYPSNMVDMRKISGVGEKKLEQYGQVFIDEILAYVKKEATKSNKSGGPKGSTYLVTYDYFRNGMEVEDIAAERRLHETTIYSHLAHLYKNDYEIDIFRFVTKEDVAKVKEAVSSVGTSSGLKILYEELNEELPYHKIRLGLAVLEKEKRKW